MGAETNRESVRHTRSTLTPTVAVEDKGVCPLRFSRASPPARNVHTMAVLATFGIIDELAASDATAALVVVGIELALIALAGAVAYLAGSWGAGLVGTLRREGPYLVAARRRRARRAVVGVVVPLAIAVLAYNGWWISRGVDVAGEAQELLAWITGDMWLRNRDALIRILAAALAVAVGAPLAAMGAARRRSRREPLGSRERQRRQPRPPVHRPPSRPRHRRLSAGGSLRGPDPRGARGRPRRSDQAGPRLSGRRRRRAGHPLFAGDRRDARCPRPPLRGRPRLDEPVQSPAAGAADLPRLPGLRALGGAGLAAAAAARAGERAGGMGAAAHPGDRAVLPEPRGDRARAVRDRPAHAAHRGGRRHHSSGAGRRSRRWCAAASSTRCTSAPRC